MTAIGLAAALAYMTAFLVFAWTRPPTRRR